MNIGDPPHEDSEDDLPPPSVDGLIDPESSLSESPSLLLEEPAVDLHHLYHPTPAAPLNMEEEERFIPKIEGSHVTKIQETLESKKNNWVLWAGSMRNLFDVNDVVKYIAGLIKRPNPLCNMLSYKNWWHNNAYAKMLIDNNIAVEEKTHTQGCCTAARVWQNLRVVYQSLD